LSTMKISENEIKDQIKRKLAINTLIDTKIAQKIVVTDEESKAFYDANQNLFKQPEQVRAGQILIKVEPGADEQKKTEAMKKIKEVQTKLKGGQDFAALAKAYSEDEQSSSDGGDLGYFTRGQMAKPIEDAAFKMQPNEVSEIIKTQFGYHLVKVYDKKPEKILAYGEIKDLLAEHMRKEKTEKETAKYIAELMKDAKIEKYR
jgi:peptidyl-prolyl cis-trans isomerase C